ncbi:MAG TPA: hypothetical protein VFA18_12605 [Gemmataceae bacterium]|nr:hypothetical protein [Gemmataceae bacterium]
MAIFTCKFTNNTNETVRIGLFGKDYEYRTDVLVPHNSETANGENLIVGSDRVAVAFSEQTGKVMAQKEAVISEDTGIILIHSVGGNYAINFVGLPPGP